jgi:tRNA-specific 2-thiouridylase
MDKYNRVVIAMSGGVDSSVAAALLINQGYDVIGVMLDLWNVPEGDSDNRLYAIESMDMAKRIADKLKIPFYILDAKEIFNERIVMPFISAYKSGQTPNPCIWCNKYIRWCNILNFGRIHGIEKIATGHYVRSMQNSKGQYLLLKAIDTNKDQSYFLYKLNQEELKATIFPLGDLHKSEVRKIADKFDLPVADRKDSQDLCFLTGNDYRQYLKTHYPECNLSGDIKSVDGKILGEHEGISFYTIGQRKALAIHSSKPQYVIDINPFDNSITVGPRELLHISSFIVSDLNWISGNTPSDTIKVEIKIRYKSKLIQGNIVLTNHHHARVNLVQPVAGISPGQSAVFYCGEICLGGGVIQQSQRV